MNKILRKHTHLCQTQKSARINKLTKKVKHVTVADSEKEGKFLSEDSESNSSNSDSGD